MWSLLKRMVEAQEEMVAVVKDIRLEQKEFLAIAKKTEQNAPTQLLELVASIKASRDKPTELGKLLTKKTGGIKE